MTINTRCDGNISNIKGTMKALATGVRREMHNVSVNKTWICLTVHFADNFIALNGTSMIQT